MNNNTDNENNEKPVGLFADKALKDDPVPAVVPESTASEEYATTKLTNTNFTETDKALTGSSALN